MFIAAARLVGCLDPQRSFHAKHLGSHKGVIIMTCVHLQQLYQLCQDHDLKISSGDLVRMVCKQCGEHEVCPSVLTDEYDADVEQQTKPNDKQA
jgi:hypothetical protein